MLELPPFSVGNPCPASMVDLSGPCNKGSEAATSAASREIGGGGFGFFLINLGWGCSRDWAWPRPWEQGDVIDKAHHTPTNSDSSKCFLLRREKKRKEKKRKELASCNHQVVSPHDRVLASSRKAMPLAVPSPECRFTSSNPRAARHKKQISPMSL